MVSVKPTTSKVKSAPLPPVSSFTRATGSPSAALTVWVAPNFMANSSWLSRRSTAMMVVALARAAPMMTLMPTPPQPTTATLLPGVTLALLTTAPTPVGTQQPMSAAWGMGVGISMGTQPISGTTAYSAKQATLPMWWMRVSPLCRRCVPSIMFGPVAMWLSHTCELPERQELQRPQAGTKGQYHLLAGADGGDAGADGLDGAGSLVAQHHGQGDGGVAVHEVAVAAADAGGPDFHQNFPFLGVVQLHVFNHQRGFGFVKYGGLQFGTPMYQYRFAGLQSPSIFHPGRPGVNCGLSAARAFPKSLSESGFTGLEDFQDIAQS